MISHLDFSSTRPTPTAYAIMRGVTSTVRAADCTAHRRFRLPYHEVDYRMIDMEQPPKQQGLNAPPRILLWLFLVIFFLLIVGALAGISYFGGGRRLGVLVPYAAVAFVGVLVAAVGGAFIFRRSLPRLMWLWVS